MKKLISFPSAVLWALTSQKSHQRGTRTMRATGMIFSVLSHTCRQYLYSFLVTFPCFHLLHTLYLSLSSSLAPLLEFLLIGVGWLSLEMLSFPVAGSLNYVIFKFPSNTNHSVIVDPSTQHTVLLVQWMSPRASLKLYKKLEFKTFSCNGGLETFYCSW